MGWRTAYTHARTSSTIGPDTSGRLDITRHFHDPNNYTKLEIIQHGNPKKVPKTTSSAMQVNEEHVKDGQGANRAASVAACVGDGGGDGASPLDVYVYATPRPN